MIWTPESDDLNVALQGLRGLSTPCDEGGERVRNARAALEDSMMCMRIAGFECDMVEAVVGDFARVSLSYGTGVQRKVIEDGCRVGEPDNEAILLTWWAFEMRKIAGSLACR